MAIWCGGWTLLIAVAVDFGCGGGLLLGLGVTSNSSCSLLSRRLQF